MKSRVPAGTQALAGLEMGGIPVATALSLETGPLLTQGGHQRVRIAAVQTDPRTSLRWQPYRGRFQNVWSEREVSISAPIWCPLRQITLYLASVSAKRSVNTLDSSSSALV